MNMFHIYLSINSDKIYVTFFLINFPKRVDKPSNYFLNSEMEIKKILYSCFNPTLYQTFFYYNTPEKI